MSPLACVILWMTSWQPCWWHPCEWHLCLIVDDISRDDISLDNTSVESLMSSLEMTSLWITYRTPLFNRWWHDISRDDIPMNDTSVESSRSSLGMTSLWITPLLNPWCHLSGWHSYEWHLCWWHSYHPMNDTFFVTFLGMTPLLNDTPVDDIPSDKHLVEYPHPVSFFTSLSLIFFSFSWALFSSISSFLPWT